MKHKKINIFVFIGIIAIIALQMLWLYNTYTALEKNLYKECNTILLKAIRREISIRFQEAPKGTEIVGTSIHSDMRKNELAPEIVSINEGLSNIGLEISLKKINSIVSENSPPELVKIFNELYRRINNAIQGKTYSEDEIEKMQEVTDTTTHTIDLSLTKENGAFSISIPPVKARCSLPRTTPLAYYISPLRKCP